MYTVISRRDDEGDEQGVNMLEELLVVGWTKGSHQEKAKGTHACNHFSRPISLKTLQHQAMRRR